MTPLDALAVGPHPDDVELFCGGTVASLVARGHRVAVLDLTAGERASNGTPAVRAAEAAEAARVLGAPRFQLGLPDLGISDDAAPLLAAVLRLLRPRLVLSPASIERHPDHAAAASLVQRAVFLAGVGGADLSGVHDAACHAAGVPTGSPLPRHRVREVLWYPMRVLCEPSFVVDTSAHVETKRRAIQCHASQLGGPVPTLVGSPDALARLEDRDRFYGAQIGTAAGEPFIVHSRLAVDDPVAHWADDRAPAFFPGRATP